MSATRALKTLPASPKSYAPLMEKASSCLPTARTLSLRSYAMPRSTGPPLYKPPRLQTLAWLSSDAWSPLSPAAPSSFPDESRVEYCTAPVKPLLVGESYLIELPSRASKPPCPLVWDPCAHKAAVDSTDVVSVGALPKIG